MGQLAARAIKLTLGSGRIWQNTVPSCIINKPANQAGQKALLHKGGQLTKPQANIQRGEVMRMWQKKFCALLRYLVFAAVIAQLLTTKACW